MATRNELSADDYETLQLLLRERFESLSKQLKTIARFMTDHPSDTALETAQHIARQLHVQPSSLIRFARALGYGGFSEIQAIYRAHVRNQLPGQSMAYGDRIADLRHAAASGRLLPSIVQQFVTVNTASLEQLSAELDINTFERAALTLRRAHNVFVFGQRRSFPAAVYMFYTLEQLEGNVYLIDSVGGLQYQQLRNIKKGDVSVIITFPTYSEDALRTAQESRDKGATVISFTDSPLSPIVQLSNIFFCTDRITVSGFRAVAATMTLAQMLSIAAGASNKRPPSPTRPRVP
jgi:DNA-binding MurR/RpiR family transcriptional regulator